MACNYVKCLRGFGLNAIFLNDNLFMIARFLCDRLFIQFQTTSVFSRLHYCHFQIPFLPENNEV